MVAVVVAVVVPVREGRSSRRGPEGGHSGKRQRRQPHADVMCHNQFSFVIEWMLACQPAARVNRRSQAKPRPVASSRFFRRPAAFLL